MRLLTISILLISFFSTLLFGAEKWEIENDGKNYKVYSREVKGSDIREVKAVVFIKGTINEAVKIIFDRKSHPGTLPYMKKSIKLSQDDKCDVSYNVVSPPIVSNRDYVVKSCVEKLADNKTRLYWYSSDHKKYPENDDNVRVKINKGHYIFTQINKDTLKIDYYIYTDPAGSLPAFIRNRANKTAVLDVIFAIRDEIQSRRKDGKA